MTSKYEIVIYQNMISGEYINIGIYTYNDDDTKVYNKFRVNWEKYHAIFDTGKDGPIDILLTHMIEDLLSKVEDKTALEEVHKMCDGPYSSLAIIRPRASLLLAEKLLEDIEKDILV